MISVDITLLIHIVNMIVLMFVLNAILYKPVLGMLDQRARKMAALSDEVAQYEETARQRRAELDGKMREASNRAKKALDGARSQAQAAGAEQIIQRVHAGGVRRPPGWQPLGFPVQGGVQGRTHAHEDKRPGRTATSRRSS